MHRSTRPARPRRFVPGALPAALLVCLALAACGEADVSRAELVKTVRQQQKAGDFAGTVEPLREYLGVHTDDAQLNYLYGRALSMTQPHLAIWPLRKAAEDPEWFVRAGMQLAFVSLAAKDFDEAIEISGEILERQPENLRARMIRANAYAHSKTAPELAIADARRMLEIDPDVLEAYEPLILGLLGLERLEEAGAALDEVGRRQREGGADPAQLAWHCVTTALFQQQSERLEDARATLAACLSAHPTNLDVVASASQFFDARGEPERSLEILRNALEEKPSARPFRVTLAQRLAASGQTAEADALLLEATESTDPQAAAVAWVDLGKLRQTFRHYGPAADALERAVELLPRDDPAAALVQFELADALVLAKRFDRAMAVADDLPIPAHRHLIRGRALQEQRQPAQALAELDESIQLWPDNPWTRYYAALAAEELGDFERALIEFRNSVRSNPAATDARTRGAALLLASGHPTAARVMLLTEQSEAPLQIEGLLLAMHLTGLRGDTNGVAQFLGQVAALDPEQVGQALAEAAAGLAVHASPALAMDMLAKAPVDLRDPRNAAALRALVRYAHAASEIDARRAAIYELLDRRPESGPFAEIRALDLELSGAEPNDVRAAYERALALAPDSADALNGLGQVTLRTEPDQALAYFDRAAALDPSNSEPKLGAALALLESERGQQAAERLDALLVEHPHEADAAYERARLDLERGVATEQTLERANRAVRFGGGNSARELLERVRELLAKPAA